MNRPILKLTDEDYNEQHLQEPWPNTDRPQHQHQSAPVHATNDHRMARGKPTSERREGDAPHPRRYFSSESAGVLTHPDDDVISMGGTLIRLCDHGHEVQRVPDFRQHRGV